MSVNTTSFRDSVDRMFTHAAGLMSLAPGLEEKIRRVLDRRPL